MLLPEGRREAHDLASLVTEAIASRGMLVDVILVSPSYSALETAQTVFAAIWDQVPVIALDGLREKQEEKVVATRLSVSLSLPCLALLCFADTPHISASRYQTLLTHITHHYMITMRYLIYCFIGLCSPYRVPVGKLWVIRRERPLHISGGKFPFLFSFF